MNRCWFMDWVEIDRKRYFYSPQFHSIIKVGIKEESAEIERQFLDDAYSPPGKYITIQYFDNKIFLFPLYGGSICIYDLIKKNIENIQLDKNTGMAYSIISSVCLDNKIIGIPGRYSQFVIIDGRNNIKSEIDFDKEKLNENKMKNERSIYFTRSNYVYNNNLFVGSLLNNYIVSISLDSYEIEYYEIESFSREKKGIYTLCGNGKELYILGNDGKLRIYEILQKKILLKKIINTAGIDLNDGVYTSSLYMNKKIIVFSINGIFIYDLTNDSTRKYSLDIKTKVDSEVNNIGFLYAWKSNEVIKAMSAINFVEYSFNENLDIIEEKEYYVDDDELCKLKLCSLAVENKEVYNKNLKFMISQLKR